MYEKELSLLKIKNRLRSRKIYNENIIDLASNDYLALSEKKELINKTYNHLQKYKYHSSKASIVINGYHPAHKLLEDKLKEINNFEEAIVLGNGFMANMALFELGRKGDLFLVDEEYHASGIVGSKLTQAEVKFFKHNDIKDLKSKNYKGYNRVFIVVEGIYSMRGDKVSKEITTYAQNIGTLIIDEAHSVGVMGKSLMGISDEYKLDPQKTIKMGTLGKALVSYGAYILANKEIIEFLINRAKTIIYTTALSPFNTLLAYYSIKEVERHLEFYKEKIEIKKELLNSSSLIKTVKIDDIKTLMQKQKELLNKNILISAIRPPTVKEEPIFRIIGRVNIKNEIIKNTIDFLKG